MNYVGLLTEPERKEYVNYLVRTGNFHGFEDAIEILKGSNSSPEIELLEQISEDDSFSFPDYFNNINQLLDLYDFSDPETKRRAREIVSQNFNPDSIAESLYEDCGRTSILDAEEFYRVLVDVALKLDLTECLPEIQQRTFPHALTEIVEVSKEKGLDLDFSMVDGEIIEAIRRGDLEDKALIAYFLLNRKLPEEAVTYLLEDHSHAFGQGLTSIDEIDFNRSLKVPTLILGSYRVTIPNLPEIVQKEFKQVVLSSDDEIHFDEFKAAGWQIVMNAYACAEVPLEKYLALAKEIKGAGQLALAIQTYRHYSEEGLVAFLIE